MVADGCHVGKISAEDIRDLLVPRCRIVLVVQVTGMDN
jgi:hypothetical protein